MTQKTDRFKQFNKPETVTSLAAKYGVSQRTFRKWITPIEEELNITHRKIFTPIELNLIINFLGEYNLDT
jgi:transposase-like protein